MDFVHHLVLKLIKIYSNGALWRQHQSSSGQKQGQLLVGTYKKIYFQTLGD